MNALRRPDLNGRSILIVEDAFYLAIEIKEEVERAGGTVAGPCADAKDGLAELERRTPDGAVVDINLGWGPSFEIADALRAASVPFVFLTGYDAAVIPDRFDDVDRIQKPVNIARLLAKLGDLTTPRGGASSPDRRSRTLRSAPDILIPSPHLSAHPSRNRATTQQRLRVWQSRPHGSSSR